MVDEDSMELIHKRMLKVGEFLTAGAASKKVGFDRSTLSVAFRVGLERGWYTTRDSAKWTNPITGGPATEYSAVPRRGPRG
ncbi:hypothetical protein [Nocardioides sp. 503]|uniref:hypothetical protein n=1 Tax=Nocardioides sp. 503 TaxID=2508326 RepID=UPI001070698F|nr:hypothetical protein [Nocardioides sp. 503]